MRLWVVEGVKKADALVSRGKSPSRLRASIRGEGLTRKEGRPR